MGLGNMHHWLKGDGYPYSHLVIVGFCACDIFVCLNKKILKDILYGLYA